MTDYDQLYREMTPVLAGIARDHAAGEDAEDVVQDTWERLIRHGDSALRNPAGYATYIARNRAVSISRHAAVVTKYMPRLLERDEPDHADGVAARDAASRLMGRVRQLPGRQRDVIMMRLDGASEAEISAALGITAGTVKKHASRARQTLRGAL